MFNNNQDRLIGVGATVGGIAITTLFFLLSNRKSTNVVEDVRNDAKKTSEDDYHKTRYQQDTITSAFTHHYGSCHCHQIKFKIRATKVLNAVDIPSKIRFPRVTIPCVDFELMCDERALSMYTVKYGEGLLGIHSFCSFCGVQVLYSPTVEPFEIQVNVDCLDRHSVEKVNVTYHSTGETDRLTKNHELSHIFNRRGIGAEQFPPSSSSNNYVQHHLFSSPAHLGSGSKSNNGYLQREESGHYQSEFCSSTGISDCGEDITAPYSSFGTHSRLSGMSEGTYSDLYMEYGTDSYKSREDGSSESSRRYSDLSGNSSHHSALQISTSNTNSNGSATKVSGSGAAGFSHAQSDYYQIQQQQQQQQQQLHHQHQGPHKTVPGSGGSVSGRRSVDGTDRSSSSSFCEEPLSLHLPAGREQHGGYAHQQDVTPLTQHRQLKKFMQPYLKPNQ